MLSVHDLFGNYLEVSPECQDVLRWSQDALLGSSSADFVHPDDMHAVEESYTRAVQERIAMYLVCRVETPSGYTWVASRFHAQDEGDGTVFIAATQSVDRPDSGRAWFAPGDTVGAKAPGDLVQPKGSGKESGKEKGEPHEKGGAKSGDRPRGDGPRREGA